MADAQPDDLSVRLKRLLEKPDNTPVQVANHSIRALPALKYFYAMRSYRPAWVDRGSYSMVEQLVKAIETADAHGLTPTDYHLAALREAQRRDDRFILELLATDAYLTLGAHLLGGRLDPVSLEADWTAGRRERDLTQALSMALRGGRVAASLDDMAPHTPGYRILMKALTLYRQAAHDGGWESIPAGPPMKAGNQDGRVPVLRSRLRATGLLGDEAADSATFDSMVEAAVVAFQRRAGLESDGIVGRKTLRELNKGPEARIGQIRVNLERWRWLPEVLGKRHIRVNIADYRLEAWNNNHIEEIHDVIVGQTYRKTPVFSSQISYVVFNPWWETPPKLARLDKLSLFLKHPGEVERLGFEILDETGRLVDSRGIDWSDYSPTHFPFRLRQRPGPLNALGRVKIIFPNKYNVYLHDTPMQELFTHTERTFSSGCVRVADALGLTQWVLAQTPGWSRERIDAVAASGKETRVDLIEKLPVYILYFTAVSDPDGGLRLINDIYQRDDRLLSALSSPPPLVR